MTLLPRFGLMRGIVSVQMAPESQRLVAYLAVTGRPVRRELAAGVLWPCASEPRARCSLRAAVARLGRRAPGVLRVDALEVALATGVTVDLHDARRTATRLLGSTASIPPEVAAAAIPQLSLDLLAGWYEDWVLLEAENWRQLRLHALEAAAGVLAAAGRLGEAVVAAQAAVSADPLRESPHAALIAVHLLEGNQSEALRAFERYRVRLTRVLGLEPTAGLRALLPPRAVREPELVTRPSRHGHGVH